MSKIIINTHLSLSEIIPEQDKADLIYHINDPTVAQNTLTIPYPYGEEDAEFYFNLLKERNEQFAIPTSFAIRYDGRLIGSIGRLVNHGIFSHKDEIGYYIGRDYRGRGNATQAVKAYCDFLHQKQGLKVIEAGVYLHNSASMRVLEKAGFEKLRIKEKHAIKGDLYLDVLFYEKNY